MNQALYQGAGGGERGSFLQGSPWSGLARGMDKEGALSCLEGAGWPAQRSPGAEEGTAPLYWEKCDTDREE